MCSQEKTSEHGGAWLEEWGVTGLRSRCQDIQVWVSAGKPKRIQTHPDVKVTHRL